MEELIFAKYPLPSNIICLLKFVLEMLGFQGHFSIFLSFLLSKIFWNEISWLLCSFFMCFCKTLLKSLCSSRIIVVPTDFIVTQKIFTLSKKPIASEIEPKSLQF